jgi:hypothetical protein
MLSILRSAAPFFALVVLTAGLLAGCGGGGGDQSGGSQEGGGGGEQQKQSKKEARETKIGVGNVISVKPDKRRMVVQPSQEAEDAEKIPINVRKNAEITLGGQKAEMADVAEGQQAQVEYVVKNDVNRAVSVQLFKAEEQPSGDQPAGEGTSN